MQDNSSNQMSAIGIEPRSDQRKGTAVRRLIWGVGGGFLLFASGLMVHQSGAMQAVADWFGVGPADRPALAGATDPRSEMALERQRRQKDLSAPAPRQPVGFDGYFVPPSPESIPDTPFGQAVERGRQIFMNTGANAADFVGNGLSCSNCHLDQGRRENSAPMWAAFVSYPAYRSKTKDVSTMADRVQGCFTYSMNAQASAAGAPPPPGHQIYKDLESYFYWMANGAPVGEKMPGRGYPELAKPEHGYDRGRGAAVYAANCALCHGEQGEGRKDLNGRYIFPALWGPDSYNWGAGMHRIDTAAGFIKANMPLGKPNSLTDQEAWDVASFINSHERPKDPRQKGTLEEADAEFHAGEADHYGDMIDGHLLGQGTALPGKMTSSDALGN